MREPPVSKTTLVNLQTGKEFEILFYGLEKRDLMLVPNPYMHALEKRRGISSLDYSSSPFFVEQIR